MAGSIGLAEYIQADFHQIVTAVLLAIALQIRFLSRHQITRQPSESEPKASPLLRALKKSPFLRTKTEKGYDL